MKAFMIIILSGAVLFSCSPVLRKDLMSQGRFDVRFSELKEDPARYSGQLFILGGVIVETTITKNGSLIEAIYAPVNSRGYLKDFGTSGGRFLALFRGPEILDPLIFRKQREITLAGEFTGLRKGKIGDMEYTYPLFDIKQVYLWEEIDKRDYFRDRFPPYYPPWYWRDRYHYPYFDPWWYY